MSDLISSYLIERIESCGFECEAGPLTMSRDWQYLKDELKQANAALRKLSIAAEDPANVRIMRQMVRRITTEELAELETDDE